LRAFFGFLYADAPFYARISFYARALFCARVPFRARAPFTHALLLFMRFFVKAEGGL
jgi:hypothetical protein